MIPRNPDQEMPDTRTVAQKMKDEGKEPKMIPTESAKSDTKSMSDETDVEVDELDEMAKSSNSADELLSNLSEFNIKSLSDLYKIKEMMIQYENKKLYGMGEL